MLVPQFLNMRFWSSSFTHCFIFLSQSILFYPKKSWFTALISNLKGKCIKLLTLGTKNHNLLAQKSPFLGKRCRLGPILQLCLKLGTRNPNFIMRT
jgi:hypothetical protein